MSTRDHDTERNVRIEQDESARKNGRNGKHLMVEATTTKGDNSVEKSLEEFIARANSTFLDADGWDLKPEPEPPKPEPPKPEPVAIPAAVAATTVSPADVAKAVSTTDTVAEDHPIAPTDATHVVAREAIAPPPPVVITRMSWGGMFVAFLLGGGLVFGGMRFLPKKAAPGDQPQPTQAAAAAPAEVKPIKPSAGPAEEITAVQPETQPAVQPTAAQPGAGEPGAAPANVEPGAPGAVAAQPGAGEPGAAAGTTPPQGAVVEPLAQPATQPDKAVAKVEPKKGTTSKKDEPKKTEPKKTTTAKGGIVDPFGDTPAPKKEEPKKKPPKKKDAPKGGIVDPFAT